MSNIRVVNSYRAPIVNDIDECLHLADVLSTQTLCVKDVANQTHIRLRDFGRPDPIVKWCARCAAKLAKLEEPLECGEKRSPNVATPEILDQVLALMSTGMGLCAASREVGVKQATISKALKRMRQTA